MARGALWTDRYCVSKGTASETRTYPGTDRLVWKRCRGDRLLERGISKRQGLDAHRTAGCRKGSPRFLHHGSPTREISWFAGGSESREVFRFAEHGKRSSDSLWRHRKRSANSYDQEG